MLPTHTYRLNYAQQPWASPEQQGYDVVLIALHHRSCPLPRRLMEHSDVQRVLQEEWFVAASALSWSASLNKPLPEPTALALS